jgi:hypothetical protein
VDKLTGLEAEYKRLHADFAAMSAEVVRLREDQTAQAKIIEAIEAERKHVVNIVDILERLTAELVARGVRLRPVSDPSKVDRVPVLVGVVVFAAQIAFVVASLIRR